MGEGFLGLITPSSYPRRSPRRCAKTSHAPGYAPLLTASHADVGTHCTFSSKLSTDRGLHYWSNAFRDPAVEQTLVPVRYDPYDVGVAYAYVGQRWVTCCSEHYAVFRGRSDREMMLAATELRRRLRDHSRNTQLTARKLADFVTSIEAEETLLLQRLRDAETKHVNQVADEHRAELENDLGPVTNELEPSPAQSVTSQSPVVLQPEIFEEY